MAKAAGLKCGRGVQVNEYLETSDPAINALGEIAEYKKKLYGITAAAEEQADTLSNYLNGDLHSYYSGSTLLNILKFDDLDLFSIGIIPMGSEKDDYEELIYTDLVNSIYKKCIIQEDKLVGAIMIGDKSQFSNLKNLIVNKIELSDLRNKLILGDQKSEPLLGKVICSCNNVGSGNLEKAIAEGCNTLEKICIQTGAGTGCGSCKPEISEFLMKQAALVS